MAFKVKLAATYVDTYLPSSYNFPGKSYGLQKVRIPVNATKASLKWEIDYMQQK
jgi:hypothetical protein